MRFVKWVDSLNEWVGNIFCSTLIFIMVFAIYEVISRYVFSSPTSWVWEIGVQLLCLMNALGGGYALLHKAHVNVDIVVARLSRKTRSVLDILTSPLFFIFSGALIWFATKDFFHSYTVGERVLSSLASPLWPSKAVVVIGAVLIFLQGIANLIRDIKFVFGGKE